MQAEVLARQLVTAARGLCPIFSHKLARDLLIDAIRRLRVIRRRGTLCHGGTGHPDKAADWSVTIMTMEESGAPVGPRSGNEKRVIVSM